MVRPGGLVDGQGKGSWHAAEDACGIYPTIPRADVADFVVKACSPSFFSFGRGPTCQAKIPGASKCCEPSSLLGVPTGQRPVAPAKRGAGLAQAARAAVLFQGCLRPPVMAQGLVGLG